MPRSPAFDLFEFICAELTARESTIIPADEVDAGILDDLKDHYEETSDGQALERALQDLRAHFQERRSILPFDFSSETGQFAVTDVAYTQFVAFARDSRGVGGVTARSFEERSAARIAGRLTGAIHCVGWPRTQRRRKREFTEYLRSLGFDRNCLEPRDKDGGFDILWLPPLGTVPLRTIVSLQCKNSSFDEDEANKSVGRARRTLSRHSYLRHDHLCFVLFNDYVDTSFRGRAVGWTFLPLGISDLGSVHGVSVETSVL